MAGDDGDVHTLGAKLRGVGVAKAVGVNTLVDPRPGGDAFEHHADVGVRHRVAVECAEDGVATACADLGASCRIELDARPRVEACVNPTVLNRAECANGDFDERLVRYSELNTSVVGQVRNRFASGTPGLAAVPTPVPPPGPGPSTLGPASTPSGPELSGAGPIPRGPRPAVRTSVRISFPATREQVFKSFPAIANLADKSDGGKISIVVEGQAGAGYDGNWLRNAVQEPLDEANIDGLRLD